MKGTGLPFCFLAAGNAGMKQASDDDGHRILDGQVLARSWTDRLNRGLSLEIV